MSLDFAILSKAGAPEKIVSIGLDSHHKIVMAINMDERFSKFRRIHNYYEDADFDRMEVKSLMEELKILRTLDFDDDLNHILTELNELMAIALSKNIGISVISD